MFCSPLRAWPNLSSMDWRELWKREKIMRKIIFESLKLKRNDTIPIWFQTIWSFQFFSISWNEPLLIQPNCWTFVVVVVCVMNWVSEDVCCNCILFTLTACLLTINKISDFILGTVLHVSLKVLNAWDLPLNDQKTIMNHHNFTMYHQAIRLICFSFLFARFLYRRPHSVYFASIYFSSISMSVVYTLCVGEDMSWFISIVLKCFCWLKMLVTDSRYDIRMNLCRCGASASCFASLKNPFESIGLRFEEAKMKYRKSDILFTSKLPIIEMQLFNNKWFIHLKFHQ